MNRFTERYLDAGRQDAMRSSNDTSHGWDFSPEKPENNASGFFILLVAGVIVMIGLAAVAAL